MLASSASPVFPAGSGVGEGADDQDGFLTGVVGSADGFVFGSRVLMTPVADARLAQVTEPDRVAAGLVRKWPPKPSMCAQRRRLT